MAIEAKDQDGCTALIWACRETKDPRVIELLLAAGASPNEKAKNGWTPLHWVATFSKGTMGAAITKTLLDHGADPMVQASGMTPLEWARRNDNPAVEAMLNPATARAAAASLELDKAMKGPLSGLRADKVRLTASPLPSRRSLCKHVPSAAGESGSERGQEGGRGRGIARARA